MNHEMMLCARDIENMYHNGTAYHKALRHMQYLLAPYEVKRAQNILRLKQAEPYKLYKAYKGEKR